MTENEIYLFKNIKNQKFKKNFTYYYCICNNGIYLNTFYVKNSTTDFYLFYIKLNLKINNIDYNNSFYIKSNLYSPIEKYHKLLENDVLPDDEFGYIKKYVINSFSKFFTNNYLKKIIDKHF